MPENTSEQSNTDTSSDATVTKTDKAFSFLSNNEYEKLGEKDRAAYLAKEEAELTSLLGEDESEDDKSLLRRRNESVVEEETSDADVQPLEKSQNTSSEKSSDQADDDNLLDLDTKSAPAKPDKLTQTEQRLTQLEKSYKDLQAEFTRKSQELADIKRSKSHEDVTELTDEQKERKTKLAQLAKEHPEAVELIKALHEEEIKKHLKPIEERVAVRERLLMERQLTEEIAEFRKGPLASLEADAVAIFEENPQKFNGFLSDGVSVMKELTKELFARKPEEVALLMLRWKKRQRQTGSNKAEVNKAQVNRSSTTTTDSSDRSVNDYSLDDFKKLKLSDMERLLPKVD